MIVKRDAPVWIFTLVVTIVVLLSVTTYRQSFSDLTDAMIITQEVINTTEEQSVSDTRVSSSETRVSSSETRVSSSEPAKLVIIATESRSGSTWLGTIFQQIPELLYVFEPLDSRHASSLGYPPAERSPQDNKQLSDNSKLKVLSSLCTCKFRTIQAFGKAPVTVEQSSQTLYNLHQEVLKGRDHMEEFCSNFTIVMPKCIRLTDISILKDLPTRGCPNFKVVHLVRDPRAVIRSRMVTFHELYSGNGAKTADMTDDMIRGAAQDLCSHGLKNGAVSEESWLKDKYLRIRYQDLVDYPYENVDKLYKFVNMPVTDSVTKFIDKSMNGRKAGSNYNVIKDSKAVAEKWRSMEPDKIKVIESACSEFLQTYGYELFDGVTSRL